jgi:putative transcriptional regulator
MLKLDVKKYVDKQFDNLNQFAKATGLNYQAAQKIYNGETTRITFDNLESICKTLKVTPNDIFTFEDVDSPTKNEVNDTSMPSISKNILHSIQIDSKNIKTDGDSDKLLIELIQQIVDNSIEDQLKQYSINVKSKSDDK